MLKNNMVITFSDIDFASDVKDFVTMSSDVSYDDEKFKELILTSEDTQLLKITKTIASPIKIINVEKVDEQFIERNI
jgi:hypothetical protein